MKDDDSPRVNLGYPLAQLLKALSGTGEQARVRAKQWQQVLTGLFDGTLRVGSQTPIDHTPPWVTLEVVHGGFATGNYAAAGPLLPHEIQKLGWVPVSGQDTNRRTLNLYFLSDLGRPEVETMLANGCFRVQLAEEGALLIATWLIERGEVERAAGLIETILPFFDRLRFYPVPHPRPSHSGTGVYVQTVGDAIENLRAKRPKVAVERMHEAIQVWAPLYDRAVGLFLETVDGDMPVLQTTESGKLHRGPTGQPIVSGGWPCRHYYPDWAARAHRLLLDYDDTRAQHQHCGKPEKPKENFALLRSYLAVCIDDPRTLTGRDVGMIRKILASYVTRHGAPGSARLQSTRAMQERMAIRPMHNVLAQVLADRLQVYPEDEGAPELHTLLGPLSMVEALHIKAPVGATLPPRVIGVAIRCLEAPLETLIELQLVPSSEVLARVLPSLTAQTRAAAISDPELRRIYQAIYLAFRRRRSLLLLDLNRQVRLEDLPWISAVEPWIGSDSASRDATRSAFIQSATLAIESFPHTILPNKLIKEFQALSAGAGISLPLVEELAADIFMGAFSEKFLRAAQVAARMLRGSLYERYYGVSYDAILNLNDVEKSRFGASISPGFARLCIELAQADRTISRSVARNGTIIEQAEILTTHNLAVLFATFDLVDSLRGSLPLLARKCFEWICQHQPRQIHDRQVQLQLIKNTAYAWRQMLFYISLIDKVELSAFLEWSTVELNKQTGEFHRRFAPALQGLVVIAGGDRFDPEGCHLPSGGLRFLGWSVGRHWLLVEST